MTGTNVFTKADFLKMFADAIADDEFVLITRETTEFEYHPKKGVKRVSFVYANSAFAVNNSLNDLISDDPMPCFSFCIAKEENLSVEALKLVKGQ